MIVTMKKVTVVCLAAERDTTTAALSSLGTLHVVPVIPPASADLEEARRRRDLLGRVLHHLASRKVEAIPASSADPALILAQAELALDELKKGFERGQELAQGIAQLRPWGAFSPDLLESIRQGGWHVVFCSCPVGRVPVLPEGCFLLPCGAGRGQQQFLVFSRESLDEVELPRAVFSQGQDLRGLERELGVLEARRAELAVQLDELAATHLPALQKYAAELAGREDFLRARDSMGQSGEALSWISGFIPEGRLGRLLEAARQHGWAVQHEDVAADDPQVPTSLDIPRRFRMAQLIFDFIGVLPGYHEIDVSIPLLIFLSLFCGMLVGDAGYGALLVLAGLVMWLRSPSGSQRDPLRLMLVMSGSILLFGALSGNWFGLPKELLPLPFRGIPWLRDDANADHIRLLCFCIGALHLSLARIWNSILSRSVRGALGHLGWAVFLWSNFFTVRMLLITGGELPGFVHWMYVVATVMILTCSVNWRDMGDVIYMPFNFINSLVDVLSYIRLYAVGLSGFYIASNFNAMSQSLWNTSPWLIPAGLLVLLVGHCLNIALCGMGVLVHGIRLNTLEFSGHLGLNWSGKPYRPLQRPS